MKIDSLREMFSDVIDNLKSLVDIDSVIGKPIMTKDDTTIIPITKVCCGFLTGGGDITSTKKYNNVNSELTSENPLAGIGGGVSLTPLGFLVVSGDSATIIKTEGDNLDKWLDIIQSGIKSIAKK